MNTINIQYLSTRIGELILGSYSGRLCLLDYRYRKQRELIDRRIKRGVHASFQENDDALLSSTRQQIEEYLEGRRRIFDIPLLLIGTPFQKKVWTALMEIPYGRTISYLELACAVGHEKAVRAVASANGANAMSLAIPCHRVIGRHGELVGYAGGLAAKKYLLQLEQVSPQLALDL